MVASGGHVPLLPPLGSGTAKMQLQCFVKFSAIYSEGQNSIINSLNTYTDSSLAAIGTKGSMPTHLILRPLSSNTVFSEG